MEIPTEHEEQCAFVEYLEAKGLKFTSIPNSTRTPHWGTKMKNKKSGLRPGLPDMLIILPNTGLLFIEMKRKKRSTVSVFQKEWIAELNKLDNVEAVIAKGADKAIEFVELFYNNLPKASI